jgi:hypothetical protein
MYYYYELPANAKSFFTLISFNVKWGIKIIITFTWLGLRGVACFTLARGTPRQTRLAGPSE